jgi:predicted  nucleic acid-binding Zn-ribbon protein
MKRRTDEVEKKTKDVDRLNKAYEKLMASVVDENMGPLEATIANISKEVVAKTAEAKDLQRAWVTCQTELVALTNENNGLAEKVQVGV